MPRFVSIVAVLAPIFALSVVPASAASFNCHKAKSDAEKAVCGSATLNVLDQRMDYVFRSLLRAVGTSGQRDQFRADQRNWLNVRDACGPDAQCLRDTLHERIDELNGFMAAVKASK